MNKVSSPSRQVTVLLLQAHVLGTAQELAPQEHLAKSGVEGKRGQVPSQVCQLLILVQRPNLLEQFESILDGQGMRGVHGLG